MNINALRRTRDTTRTPGPQARNRPEKDGLAGTRLTDNQHPVAGCDLDISLAQHGAASGRRDLQTLESEIVAGCLNELNAILGCPELVHSHHGLTEAGDAQQRGTPVSQSTKIV